ncbi:MAG: penicillin-binding protein 2 [Parasporobacterium sp.]|nr:penicillin-binding protein 2 [Parasporobacterium sp.]
MDKNRKKKNEEQKRFSNRFRIVAYVFFALMAVLAIRLIWIIAFDGSQYTKAALAQSETSSNTLTSKRGDIIDRNNVQLATSTKVYNLILDPRVILFNEERYLEPTVAAVSQCFGFSADELRAKIKDNPNSSYIVLAKGLTYAEVEEFLKMKEENLKINGIWLEDNYKRNYTYGTLASSVLGFTEGGSGAYGLEYMYNDELTGDDGMEYSFVNSNNVLETVRKDPEDGNTIKTTIDYNIQAIVEKHIADFQAGISPLTVACVIQNPNTGEILAMADSKNFDPNDPRNLSFSYTEEQIQSMSDQDTTNALSEIWKNFCVTQSYEPGSTFKPITLAMALEENRVSKEDQFYCTGSQVFFPGTGWERKIWCYERSGHGAMDLKGTIANSCNVSLADIAGRVGVEQFCKYQRKFGFGNYTGIDLPNEMSCEGLLYNESNMTELDLACNGFGQNFNVTMVQLSTAFSSLINGGYLYRPYTVKGIYNAEGELLKSFDRVLVTQTVSQPTCDYVKECLRAVVTDGSGQLAAIPGYKIAGKTGTAQKGDKTEDVYLISFIGFAPYDNPEVVCYVAMDEPNIGDQSGYAAACFSRIMTEVLSYMNITPDDLG